MGVSSQIPQDIIDTITDLLKGDDQTLKSCATVSRTFLRPSRKNLFYTVRVHLYGDLQQARRLYRVLVDNSEIPQFIFQLNVDISDLDVWRNLKEDETLANILGMVPCLQSLSLGYEECGSKERPLADWDDDFGGKWRPALLELFQSHILTTVEIFNIRLPLSILGVFTHVKKLRLSVVPLQGRLAPDSVLADLEVLHIRVGSSLRQNSNSECFSITSSTFPSLRRLSIISKSNDQFTQRILASTSSIEHVQWDFSMINYRDPTIISDVIDFGVMKNLKFLTCIIGHQPVTLYGWLMVLPSIIKLLKNPLGTKSLEVFTIGFLMDSNEKTLEEDRSSFSGLLEKLDAILSPLSKLRQVLIHTNSPELRAIVEAHLRQLKDRSILSIISGRIIDYDEILWGWRVCV